MVHFQQLRHARRAKMALAGALVLAANSASYAQSCALCNTQAAASGHRFIQGLRTGILVLIVPPMFMSVGITVLAYKKRNRTNDKKESDKSDNDWWLAHCLLISHRGHRGHRGTLRDSD